MDDIVIGSPSKDDCNLAMLTHLLGIVTHVLGALIIWVLKKDDSPFVGDQAREALNFQITLFIGFAISGVLVFIGIGVLMIFALMVANVVFSLIAAIAASKGQTYRYPFALRLLN